MKKTIGITLCLLVTSMGSGVTWYEFASHLVFVFELYEVKSLLNS